MELVAWVAPVGVVATLFVIALVYPLARVYILVEAFASLRSLPEGAYDTVVWAEMWPHF